MRWLHRWASVVRLWARRQASETDLDAEARSYLALLADEKVQSGMSRAEAERAARLELGGIEQTKERVRTERHGAVLDALGRDVRLAVRSLRRVPAFSLVTVLTLVLSIGGVTVVFTLVNGVLLRPLPYPDPDRLVQISDLSNADFFIPRVVEAPSFLEWRERSISFESMAVLALGYVTTLNPDTRPEKVSMIGVSSEFFPLLGVRPALGRLLLPEDEEPGAEPVTLIAYSLWQTRFGGDPDVIGQHLDMDMRMLGGGSPPVVVGVMPDGFRVPLNGPEFGEIYLPVPLAQIRQTGEDASPWFYRVIGRLKDGVSVSHASREFQRIAEELAVERGERPETVQTEVALLLDRIVGEQSRMLWLFFSAVSCVLLIAVGNLAGLQIARNAARGADLSIRVALGAGRLRLARGLLIESTLLSLVGGAGGLVLAWYSLPVVLSALPPAFPRLEDVSLDSVVLLLVTLLSLGVGPAFGVIPALRSSQPAPRLTQTPVAVSPDRARVQKTLLMAESALALVLLIVAGLLTNSLWRLSSRESGIDEANVWTSFVSLPLVYQRDPLPAEIFWNNVLEEVRNLPGVGVASLTSHAPVLSGSAVVTRVTPDSDAGSEGESVSVALRYVDSAFFPALGVPIRRGRNFSETDLEAASAVVIINEELARAAWPGEDPIGKRFRTRDGFLTVVGEAGNFRAQSVHRDVQPQIYYPRSQGQVGTGGTLVVRTRGDLPGLGTALNSLIAGFEEDARIDTATLRQLRWRTLAEESLRTGVMLSFAILAAVLALVGVFGLVAYSGTQRMREIGVRLALGADSASIRRLLLRHAVIPVMVGLALGLALSWAVTRLLEGYLFEVSATDPATIAVASLSFLIAAWVAGFLPARRSTRIDPVETLRHE